MKVTSYISAGQYPVKLLAHYLCKNNAKPRIQPIHATINITNTCNLKCPYCATKDRRHFDPPMSFELFKYIVDGLQAEGLQAMSFSGGGDATLHKEFGKFVEYLSSCGIASALVTNGTQLHRINESVLQQLSWIRVSMDGWREEIPKMPDCIFPGVSWVYRVNDADNPILEKLVEMAEDGKIKHLRIHQDIYLADKTDLPQKYAGRDGVILHERTNFSCGTERCWNGLTWPRIDVDGRMWPCCGVHYALNKVDQNRNYPEELCMGTLEEYLGYVRDQRPFDAKICDRCFYEPRNHLLDAISQASDLQNPEFA